MAFEAQQIDTRKINGGNEYSLNNALTPQDMNNIVKGIAYNSLNSIQELNISRIYIKNLNSGIYKINNPSGIYYIYYKYSSSDYLQIVSGEELFLIVSRDSGGYWSWQIPIATNPNKAKAYSYVGFIDQYNDSTKTFYKETEIKKEDNSSESVGSMTYPYAGNIEKDDMNTYNTNSSLVNENAKVGDYLLASNGLFTITSVSQMGDDKYYSVYLYFLFSASGSYKMSVIVKEWTSTNIDMNACYATLIPYKEGATVKVYTMEFNGEMLSSATIPMGGNVWETLEYDKFKLKAVSNNNEVAILQGLHIADPTIPPPYVLVVID